jgi:hypothetical protein
MEKIERILERYKIYLGVKDVKLVVRPYKTRTAFTNLSSSPPTIYLNEYLIDDEAVAEYLILRESIHIRLNMFRSRYTGGLSYTGKFNSILHFLCLGRRLKRLGRRWEKGRLRLTGDFNDLFFLWRPSRAASCSAAGAPPEG